MKRLSRHYSKDFLAPLCPSYSRNIAKYTWVYIFKEYSQIHLGVYSLNNEDSPVVVSVATTTLKFYISRAMFPPTFSVGIS